MAQLTFTIIQSNLVWQNVNENLQNFTNKINSITQSTQVVLLPEMFNTGFSMDVETLAETMDGTTIEWMKQTAINKKIIVAGSLIINENNNYYNRFVWMQPNGVLHYYNKRHCFSLANEDKYFIAGKEKIIVQANGLKICLQICYDLRFPVFSRQEKNKEYDVLIYVANWPQRREYAWKSLLVARAIENQCYVIGVNRVGLDGNNLQYSGFSSVVNAMGEVEYQKENQEDIYTFTIQKNNIDEVRNLLPFLKDADNFTIL